MTSSKNKSLSSQWVLDPEAISGWFDGAGNDVDSAVRPNQWGDFPEKPRLTSRLITITGTAIASSPPELYRMRDDLVSMFGSDKYGIVKVSNASGDRYAEVAVINDVVWKQELDSAATYRIELFAPDPRIYGETQQVQIGDSSISGGLKYQLKYPINFNLPRQNILHYITNDGSVDSWPVFIVTGDYPSGFTISDNAGHKVTYSNTVTMQAPVTIDMARGTALQSGNDVSTWVTERQWFSIPPRSSIQPRFEPKQDGLGWCDIIYRDTWI